MITASSHGDVVGVEDHQDVEQAAHLGEGVAVLVAGRPSPVPVSKPRAARDEVGQAHGHLGQAAQEGQRVVQAEVGLEARLPGHAQREQAQDGSQQDESLARAAAGRGAPLPAAARTG